MTIKAANVVAMNTSGLMNQPMGELGPPFLGWRMRQPLSPVRLESTDRQPE